MFMNPADFEFWGRKIPEGLHDGLTHYLKHHIPVGDFLTAVLENDLREACGRADDENMWLIPVIVAYLYNEAPSNSWGSRTNVEAWLATRVIEEPDDPEDNNEHIAKTIDAATQTGMYDHDDTL